MAAISVNLKAMSQVLSSTCTSEVTHGCGLGRVVKVLETVLSSMHWLMEPVTDALYSFGLVKLVSVPVSAQNSADSWGLGLRLLENGLGMSDK